MHNLIANSLVTDCGGVLFQEWLQQHGPFDAIIDGANVGLINQKTFSFSQVTEMKVNVFAN